MTSLWTPPSKFYQYFEEGAQDVDSSWIEDDFNEIRLFDKKSLGIIKPLYHIARSPQHDLMNKTYFLRLTNFRFVNVPATISGIELKINSRRAGRIMDETVQLCLNENLIGDNKALTTINPISVYGGEDDLWGTNLDASQLNDLTFGIVLRFKANPKWPHRDSIFIDSVELRIH